MSHIAPLRRVSEALVVLAIAGSATPGAAADYSLSVGASYSDNVERQPEGAEEGAGVAVVGLVVEGQRPAGRLQYDVLTDLSYHRFLDSGFDSGLQGRAYLNSNYQLRPERLNWSTNIGYEQLRSDMSRPLTPGNSENRLSLATGPSLRIPIGSAMETELVGRYARTAYGDQPFDNETLSGRVMLARRPNPRSYLGLGGSLDDVRYVSDAASSVWDFERREVFSTVRLQGIRTSVEFEGGYAEAKGDTLDEGGPLVRMAVSRNLTPTWSAYLRGAREYPTSDLTAGLEDPVGSGFGNDGQISAGPRLVTSGSLGVGFERPRISAELSYSHVRETALGDSPDERQFGMVRSSIIRRFTPGSSGSLYASYSDESFGGGSLDFQETAVGVDMGMRFGRGLGINLRVEHRDREGVSALYGSSELSGGISFMYSGQTGRGQPAE